MSDILDKFFSSVAPTQETSTEAPRSLFERFIDSIGGKPSPTPSKPPVEAPKPPPEHSIDTIFPRLIDAESKGVHMNEKGVLLKSKRGAEGITQLMPSTAAKPGYGLEPVKDKSEAEYTRLGKQYLQKMYDKFGDWEKALAAYNAGVGNVMKAEGKAERFGGDWKDHLPRREETIPYIQKIMQKGKEWGGRVNDRKPMKPLSDAGNILPATELKTPRVLEVAGELAQAAGDKVLDATGSPALATGAHVATELAADPLNAIPLGKIAMAGVIGKDVFISAVNKLKKYVTDDAIKAIESPPDFKSRERIVLMDPKEFLKAAEEGFDPDKMKRVKEHFAKGDKLPADKLPEILINGENKMWGHEGRHRARQFIEEGVELMPVKIKHGRIRFSEQGTGKFDDVGDAYPSTFVTERGEVKAFPIPKGETNLPNAGVGAGETVSSSFIPSKYIKTPFDPKTGYSSQLNNPIHLSDDAPPSLAGARLSGFTDSNNKYFHGYDKNGERFTIAADRVNPDWITTSKDSNKTAEYFRNRLKGK